MLETPKVVTYNPGSHKLSQRQLDYMTADATMLEMAHLPVRAKAKAFSQIFGV